MDEEKRKREQAGKAAQTTAGSNAPTSSASPTPLNVPVVSSQIPSTTPAPVPAFTPANTLPAATRKAITTAPQPGAQVIPRRPGTSGLPNASGPAGSANVPIVIGAPTNIGLNSMPGSMGGSLGMGGPINIGNMPNQMGNLTSLGGMPGGMTAGLSGGLGMMPMPNMGGTGTSAMNNLPINLMAGYPSSIPGSMGGGMGINMGGLNMNALPGGINMNNNNVVGVPNLNNPLPDSGDINMGMGFYGNFGQNVPGAPPAKRQKRN